MGLTSLLAAALLAAAGCSGATPSATPGATAGSATATVAPAGSQSLPFDLAASRLGKPSKAPTSAFKSSWFPPAVTDGLRQLTDGKQIRDLQSYAAANGQFWIARSGNATQPIVFGSDATKLLKKSGPFTSAIVVEMRRVKAELPSAGATSVASALEDKPSGYQVLLDGPAGISSFGAEATGTAGASTWQLEPNGELVNWTATQDVVARKDGFVATQGYVVRAVYDLGGRPALYVSWAVFRDAAGHEVVTTLHTPPPIKATWTVAGKPLAPGQLYDPSVIFGAITLTPKP